MAARPGQWPRVGWAGWAAGLWLAAAAVLAVLGYLPFWVPTVYALASLGTYAARDHFGTEETEPLPKRHGDGYRQSKVEAEQ